MLRVYIRLVGDPKKTGAKVVTRMIFGKNEVGVITNDAPHPLPEGVFKVEMRHVSCASSPALPAVLDVNAVTSSDEARRDSIKRVAAARYADFCAELQKLEHLCGMREDLKILLKISAQPHLAALKYVNEYVHEGDLYTSLRAAIVSLNNAQEEVNTHSSIDLKPILSVNTHSSIDWESYDKYIFPAGHYKIVKNESGQICGQLHPVLNTHEDYHCLAICQCPKHAGHCRRLRSWNVRCGEAPQMLERVLACWLVEGGSHVSAAKHMASHRY